MRTVTILSGARDKRHALETKERHATAKHIASLEEKACARHHAAKPLRGCEMGSQLRYHVANRETRQAQLNEMGIAHGLGRVASNAVQGTHVMPAIAIVHIDDSRPARRVAREHGHIHVGAGSQHASHHMAQRAAACYRDVDGS
jgi:hypothetical protein